MLTLGIGILLFGIVAFAGRFGITKCEYLGAGRLNLLGEAVQETIGLGVQDFDYVRAHEPPWLFITLQVDR